MFGSDTKGVLKKAINNYNEPDRRSGYLDFHDEKCVAHGLPPNIPGNKEGLKMFYNSLWSAFPDFKVNADDLISEGDKVTARFTANGTHKGEFMGVPATGKKVNFPVITTFRIQKGKCVERWTVADVMGMMRQMGAIPG
ncbi:MAG: ester cyclase [SAR202 cluster bacterium]|nr:ester cyclase [SAR202 cluster bacterium]